MCSRSYISISTLQKQQAFTYSKCLKEKYCLLRAALSTLKPQRQFVRFPLSCNLPPWPQVILQKKKPSEPPSNPQSPKGLNPCAWWILVFPRPPGTRQTAGQPRYTCLVQGMQYNSVKTPCSASPYPWFVFLCLLISFSPSMIH